MVIAASPGLSSSIVVAGRPRTLHPTMGKAGVGLAMALVLMGCNNAPSTNTSVSQGCSKDTDCKGSRVCRAGQCTDAPTSGNSASAQGQPQELGATPVKYRPYANVRFQFESSTRTSSSPRHHRRT